jgi:uncharacterized protein (TIGR03083 family)
MATVATVAVTEALTTTAERVAALALSAPDPDLMVPATPGWSVTDVLGHLALEPTRNRDLILGRGQWPSEVVDLPAFNGQQIRSLPTRNVSDLAATLRAEVAIMLATAADFGDEPTMMKSDATNGSEPTGTGTLLGEFAVHGHFIAGALGRPWPIEPAHKPIVMHGLHQVMPGWVDPAKAIGHTATYERCPRGLPTTVTTTRRVGSQVQCHRTIL